MVFIVLTGSLLYLLILISPITHRCILQYHVLSLLSQQYRTRNFEWYDSPLFSLLFFFCLPLCTVGGGFVFYISCSQFPYFHSRGGEVPPSLPMFAAGTGRTSPGVRSICRWLTVSAPQGCAVYCPYCSRYWGDELACVRNKFYHILVAMQESHFGKRACELRIAGLKEKE